ncbi:aminoglycoside phosphotransferase family protein [Streptomyces sp. NBC_00237]|uniref:phosphotransferase family protein n=1 Tax=Streptomyces sp. NBC_00237 TaxID=2975687 RepID=UPI002254DC06|nr:phosphotransferase [Streptomyces sp. NBC_00237]MCX5202394.1 aminoglycoside phosphotransferase family protein [Streptomyces sp. NBC_00237]
MPPPTPEPTPAPELLATRPDDATVIRQGPLVLKTHAPDSDPTALATRIAVAAHPLLTGILLPPLPIPAAATPAHPDRSLSAWPYGTPVDPEDPDAAPWEETATLLARLHRTPPEALPAPLPPMRGPAKAARALARMHATAPHPAAPDAHRTVLAAWHGLPAWARDERDEPDEPDQDHVRPTAALCHGDLHLGQLVRHPAPSGPWHLIDVDDLGLGDPAWDLARPAAWYAAGLLDPDVWQRFLTAYRAADGPAVRPHGDPWPELDVAARALTVQTAALALAKSTTEARPLDEVEHLMIDSCARIASLRPELDGSPPP